MVLTRVVISGPELVDAIIDQVHSIALDWDGLSALAEQVFGIDEGTSTVDGDNDTLTFYTETPEDFKKA